MQLKWLRPKICGFSAKRGQRATEVVFSQYINIKWMHTIPHTRQHIAPKCLNAFSNQNIWPARIEWNVQTTKFLWCHWNYGKYNEWNYKVDQIIGSTDSAGNCNLFYFPSALLCTACNCNRNVSDRCVRICDRMYHCLIEERGRKKMSICISRIHEKFQYKTYAHGGKREAKWDREKTAKKSVKSKLFWNDEKKVCEKRAVALLKWAFSLRDKRHQQQ